MQRNLERLLKKTLGIDSSSELLPLLELAQHEAQRSDCPPALAHALNGLSAFIQRVDATYEQFERDLELRSRSLELSSIELNQLNIQLQNELTSRNRAISSLNQTVATMLNSQQPKLCNESDALSLEFLASSIEQLVEQREVQRHKADRLIRALDEHAIVCLTDANHCLNYVNSRFESSYGQSAAELLGHTLQHISWPQNLTHIWHGELENRRCNGSVFWTTTTIVPLFDQNQLVTQYILISTDISQQKQTAQTLADARDQAEAANQAKSYFLANMSHEIRTPMNAIIGLSHLCLQTELETKQLDYLQKIHSSAKSLLKIINDILDYSKIEAGKMQLEQLPFELETVMSNLITVITARAEEKGLEFLLETAFEIPPRLIGDPLRLGQVLINLTSNAIKFTEAGEVVVTTKLISETEQTATLCFSIRDTGIGIAREHLPLLFESFTQADSTTTRKYGGTGLGLAICKQLVQLMGGEIWVDSSPGRGSSFHFSAQFHKAHIEQSKPSLPYQALHKLKVLSVDDNEVSRQIVENYLSALNFEVTSVADGKQALAAFEAASQAGQPYPLIIMDWKMPELDGIETSRLIRAQRTDHQPRILLNSSFSRSELEPHLSSHLVNGILAKPFTRSELFNAVVEITNTHQHHTPTKQQRFSYDQEVGKLRGAHLLLVEDNLINQQVARELLEQAHISVVIANNGKEALEYLNMEQFDGVLMDMQMPIMDGVTATQEIRRSPAWQSIPIIAMTANATLDDRERCIKSGMNDHIIKPLDPNQMMLVLARWIKPSESFAIELEQPQPLADISMLPPNLEDVDVNLGIQRMGGNIGMYYYVLKRFASDQQQSLTHIEQLAKQGLWAAAIDIAHPLKGLLGTIGAETQRQQLTELEHALQQAAPIERLLPPLKATLNKLFQQITQLDTAQPSSRSSSHGISPQQLLPELLQAKQLLQQFDAGIEQALEAIQQQLSHPTLEQIYQLVKQYDYEQALQKLSNWTNELDRRQR